MPIDPENPPLPEALAAWRSRGRFVEVFGSSVFVVEEGPADAEPLLVLHGFPTFSYDFHRVLPLLACRFRVIVHDHLGFGLSAKPARFSYSLIEQAGIALGLWRHLGIRRGHLVAHDYGTSVATEILARREKGFSPVSLASLTLSNGSVFLELAHLRLSQRLLRNRLTGPTFARLVGRAFFGRRIRALLGRPESVSEEELDSLWAGVSHGGGVERFPAISGYLDERRRFAGRWQEPLTRLDLPAHIVWGRRDPVAVPAIAERLAAAIPGARLTWLEDLGHYPMLEDPETWATAVTGFLEELAP